MSTLNVTYRGLSADVAEIDFATSDEEIKRAALEIIRTDALWGGVCVVAEALDSFVVDRFNEQDRLYLRPKVPFGSD